MPEDSPPTPEPDPKAGSELVRSLRLLVEALCGPAGIAGVTAAAMLLVVRYHAGIAADLGWLEWQWYQFGWVGLNVVCLLLVPLVVVKLAMRGRLRDYGFTFGDWRIWLKHCLVYLAVVLPIIAIASRTQAFRAYYPMFAPARQDPLLLIPWELAYGAYFFAWEFFFRGFLLQAFAKRFGAVAIIVQMLPFVMTHFGKPEPEVWGSIIAGLALGITAYRSRSFVGCWLVHWICASSMDVLAMV